MERMVEERRLPNEQRSNIIRLHSDLLGDEEDSQENAESRDSPRGSKIYLSSLVAARGVTLEDLKFMLIHPLARRTLLHQSGLNILGEERLSKELMANMAGRGGRTAPGVVIYLFEFDDTAETLLALDEERKNTPTGSSTLRAPPRG